MPKYRITNRASNHRRKEPNGWKSYRYGDEIELTQEQYESNKYSHLRLVALGATAVKEDEVERPVDPVNGNGTELVDPDAPVDEDNGGAADDTEDDEVSREKIEELLAKAKESKVDDGSFEKVREEVIALDLFDNLPETKKGVIEALEGLLD